MNRIRIWFAVIIFFGNSTICNAQLASPRALFQDLFVDVQMHQVFPDGKTFVDCIPTYSPDSILKAYHQQKKQPDFSLQQFVYAYFRLPETSTRSYHSDVQAGIRHHIEELWNVLSRNPNQQDTSRYGSLIPLPYRYIVPGGRFREVYYWDSYFTMLGLKESRDTALIEDMVKNFAYLINRFGFVPNGNRTYYLTRSQPPYFSLMVDLLAGLKGDYIYATYQQPLLREYAYWMKGADELHPGEAAHHVVMLTDSCILNRYWDESNQPREESYRADVIAARQSSEPDTVFYRNIRAAAESGMDFSSRWFADNRSLGTIITTHLIAVDLNCLLYHLEKTIARSYAVTGNYLQQKQYEHLAELRKQHLLKYCWDAQQQAFTDYDFTQKKYSPRISLASMYPLFFKLADSTQAAAMARLIRSRYLQPGGVVTTLQQTGQQWDAPNGWAPLEYITIQGLRNYHYDSLARQIALRWIQLNRRVFDNTGKLMEKYDVMDIRRKAGGGEYPTQDGFGWTNGVLLKLMNEYQVKD
ncbi:alpha,alpha-trehalase TreA [Thermoflavifilum thermophilum]|uniref:Alpha,alpha-trehalase n=1 Tax=Thermoflavifilum thermophilum TaxID=1393122 RepID=A0A1I7N8Q0_9BACT|nr:alpha,alpha-trehalase TreA [Thermoflavifilum thermophilum]SFV31018.1 alpha,alpha-trehalase [Thermoflavifilum thermophilum]